MERKLKLLLGAFLIFSAVSLFFNIYYYSQIGELHELLLEEREQLKNAENNSSKLKEELFDCLTEQSN